MIKRLLFIGIVSVGLYSCNDALDITQDGELNDQALFTDVANTQLFLNEVYDQVNIQNEIMISSILTDEVGMGSAGYADLTHAFQIFTTNGSAAAIWNQNYRAINYANRLLRGATYFTPETGEEADYNNIIAQARYIRAFSHFQLLTYFSTDLQDDNALGVMKVDFVPTAQQQIPRSTNGEVFQLIEDDLTFAAANLTNATSGGENWKYVNRNAVDALRARMYLYRGMHNLAEQYADNLINTSGIVLATSTFADMPTNFPLTSSATVPFGGTSGSSSLDSPPPGGSVQFALFEMDRWTATTKSPTYRKMWVDTHQGEVIFSLARLNNATNLSMWYNTNNSSYTGGPLWDMGRNLFELYTQPLGGGAEDFRRWSFVDRSSWFATDPALGTYQDDVIVIDKYPGKLGAHSANDVKIFRLSEMYFIKAEARVEAGDLPGAAGLIQQVRQARNYITGTTVPTPSYANETEAYADILLERRKELAFEGHRYIDLKRIGLLGGVTETDRYFRDSENASATNPFNISVTDYRFTLPIPQSEINVNPLTQNPGY